MEEGKDFLHARTADYQETVLDDMLEGDQNKGTPVSIQFLQY